MGLPMAPGAGVIEVQVGRSQQTLSKKPNVAFPREVGHVATC